MADLAALRPRPDLGAPRLAPPGARAPLLRAGRGLRPRACEGRRRVLDVGCGYGTVALELARAGHEVTALDASEEACGGRPPHARGHGGDRRRTRRSAPTSCTTARSTRSASAARCTTGRRRRRRRARRAGAGAGRRRGGRRVLRRADRPRDGDLAGVDRRLADAGGRRPAGPASTTPTRSCASGPRSGSSTACAPARRCGGARGRASCSTSRAGTRTCGRTPPSASTTRNGPRMVAQLVEAREAALIASETIPGVAFRASGTVR